MPFDGWLLRDCQALVDGAPLSEADLRPYQSEELIPFMLANPRSAAYVGMGLGKTASVLTLLDKLYWTTGFKRALIIAPVRVAVQTWPTEIGQWKHTAWMRYSLIRPDPLDPRVAEARRKAYKEANAELENGNKASSKAITAVYAMQRREAAYSDAPIHIVNREWVEGLVELFGRDWPYDVIIVDESTSFADHSTKRFKALAKVAGRTPRIHLLSGTPAPEGIHQLFAQCYLMDQGKRFGKHITHFRDEYMKQNRYTQKWEAQTGAVERVTEKMADIAIVMKEDDYLPLDKPLLLTRPIIMDKRQLAAYKDFETTSIMQLPEGVIEAVNAGVLSGKLLQFASGAVLDPNRTWHPVHDHKLTDLKELAESMPGEPLLVAYWFQSSLARIRKQFPKAVAMDKEGECVDDWNKGKIPMLLIHPQSAGHGLNMQKGPGHDLCFFDTPASLELYQQIIKRIARFGQARVVRVHHQVTKGTLDALAVPKLLAKEDAQDTIMLYLNRLRAKLRKAKAAEANIDAIAEDDL